jgi:hypothetical protein
MVRRLLVVLLSVVCGAGIALAATGRERHEAIYPQQRIPLAFSHAQHLEEGVACEGCHDPARESKKVSDRLLPAHPECDSCHDIEGAAAGKKVDPPSACSTCHLGYEPARPKEVVKASFPHANLVFPHDVHVTQKKMGCNTCHFSTATGSMEDVGLSTRYQLPKMDVCLKCHNGVEAPAQCKTCHLTDASGRLQLVFTSATLKPAQGDPLGLDHGPRYEFTHGTRAKVDRKACAECHTDSYCATCHDSLQKPLSVHPNDYVTLHPVQAKMDSTSCEGCHRLQSFCAACHERVGIGLNADPTLRARNLKVHGDYREFVEQAGPRHHAVAASRDLKQCIACHREETCTECHSSASMPKKNSVNPHPTGFAGRCRPLAAANLRACLKCHTDADLVMKDCR